MTLVNDNSEAVYYNFFMPGPICGHNRAPYFQDPLAV